MARRRFGLARAMVTAAVVTATAILLFLAAPGFSRAASRPQEEARGSDADSKAIKQVYAEWYEAFSRHDAHAAAMAFTEDADFTNMRGVHNHGRKEIEAHLAMIFAGGGARIGAAHRHGEEHSVFLARPRRGGRRYRD
jgi:hypothetical protein